VDAVYIDVVVKEKTMNTPDALNLSDHLSPDLIEELDTLREMRLGLAKKQLSEAESTIDQLIDRGLIAAHERVELLDELKIELTDKIANLNDRDQESNQVSFDDIDFYLDMLM